MQVAVKGEEHDQTRIEILPFINLDPSNPTTIYSALSFALAQCKEHKLHTCLVTFDQPLYIKAAEIVAASPDLSNVVARLGGFHLIMSYMGSIGFIMAGSGLDAPWETMYAPASVVHMLTGHAYSRALRAHLISSAAIASILLEKPGSLNDINLDSLRHLHQSLLQKEYVITNVEKEVCVQQITQVLSQLMQDVANKSRTGKLWVNYMEQVSILRLFLQPYQTIEQELMRPLKTSGGMTHGRGITESSLTKWIHALPHCIPLCDALQTFTGVHVATSEQHKDLRASSEVRDHTDHDTFVQWLHVHSPFSYYRCDSLVSISTGVVADKSVNCDNAYDLGHDAAETITNQTFTDIKLHRNDRVKTISCVANTVKIRGQSVEVNPTLLFNRITCILNSSSEMESFLSFELAPQPPSLFRDGVMRKTAKSVLATLLKSKVTAQSNLPDDPLFVIDGGYLLHTVVWPLKATYKQVCDSYVSYTLKYYGANSTIVFDGYESRNSTKTAEQLRRASKISSRDILIDRDMTVMTKQPAFLTNHNNKSKLIAMLCEEFQESGVTVVQAESDADHLIVSTALSVAQRQPRPVVVIGTDTDLFIMLISQAMPEMCIYMMFCRNPKCIYDITAIQNSIGDTKRHLMVMHAITGCDTVSSLYKCGKKKAFALIQNSKTVDHLDVFTNPNATQNEIADAGEKFILKLYRARKVTTLDKYRYIAYNQQISRSSISATFKLDSLPPTRAAARQHSYRAFLTVQQWLGNSLSPTDWGWRYLDDRLVPVETDNPVAPEKLLRLVSCGCKKGCGKLCGCRKLGLECTSMCSQCMGQTCTNISQPSLEPAHENSL